MAKKNNRSKSHKAKQKPIEKVKNKTDKGAKSFDKQKKEQKDTQNDNQMIPKVQIQHETDQKSNSIQIKAKIHYSNFTIQCLRRISQEQAHSTGEHESFVSEKLRQVDKLISRKKQGWQKHVFGKSIWVIKKNSIPLKKELRFDSVQYAQRLQEQQAIEEAQELRKIVCYMVESLAKDLILTRPGGSQDLLMFSHVGFRNLKSLFIKQEIASIEALTWMDCENLGFFEICQTLVSNSKAITKLWSRKFHSLKLSNNKLPSIQVSRINMRRGGKIQVFPTFYGMLIFGYYSKTQQIICMQDVSILAKAQTGWNSIDLMRKLADNRIQQKIFNQLYGLTNLFENILKRRNWTQVQVFQQSQGDSDSSSINLE